ncbi:MAG: hypothetical protein ACLPWS_14805, partial [Rhodomicrobium sp.]
QDFSYSPDLKLTANDGSPSITVDVGTPVTLAWSTTPDAISCAASGGWSGNQAAPSGSFTITPTVTTTYTLACTGSNNLTSTVSVTVNVNANGVCGADGGKTLTSPPVNLCAANDTASAFTATASGWTWTCTPSLGGLATACNGTLQPAQCGPDNGQTLTSQPVNLCAPGDTASAVTTTTTGWTWTCNDDNGASTANCSAASPAPPQPTFVTVWQFNDTDYVPNYTSFPPQLGAIAYQNNYDAPTALSGTLSRQMFMPSADNFTVTASFQNSANCQGKNNAQAPFNGNIQTGTATAHIHYGGTTPVIMQIAWDGCGETQNGILNPAYSNVTFEHMGLTVYQADANGNPISAPLVEAQAVSVGGHEDNTCGMAPPYSLIPTSLIDATTLSNMSCPSSQQDYGPPIDLMVLQPGSDYVLQINVSTIDELFHVRAWYQFHLTFKQ